MNAPKQDYLTADETCRLLRLDEGRSMKAARIALWRLRRDYGLPDLGKFGRTLRFSRTAIDEWAQSRCKSLAGTD